MEYENLKTGNNADILNQTKDVYMQWTAKAIHYRCLPFAILVRPGDRHSLKTIDTCCHDGEPPLRL